ncbi:hypothetical protein [Bifidobacterium jacchi]|uniref:Uncharacterized protein n=1 Tax=Bifidobacterium jacchi TaxID=2490545 RepID=A0A5N5RJU6_9BIFI|nr:hypothetical protein [Bifidobacterium jacchi]KAB5607568.1 hypothetical protein EHS19_04460 [Bifidobacterium jacchi]
MGYSTFISYNTTNADIARMIADRLTDDEGEDGWRPGTIVNLPRYTAAVRTRTVRQIQPTFLVHIHDFERMG